MSYDLVPSELRKWDCVKDEHVKLARAWLATRFLSSSPDSRDPCPIKEDEVKRKFDVLKRKMRQPNPNDPTNPTDPKEKVLTTNFRLEPKVVYPLKKLPSHFSEWETRLRVSSHCYSITRMGTVALVPNPSSRPPTIKISAYISNMATLRKAIMHEIYEVRVGEKYGVRGIDHLFNAGGACHNLAIDRTNLQYDFATGSEKAILRDNWIRYKEDLELIITHLKKIGKTKETIYDRCIQFQKWRTKYWACYVFPGYCALFRAYGYRNKRFSNIAWIFDKAKQLGVKFQW
jgi:hypothetical protein